MVRSARLRSGPFRLLLAFALIAMAIRAAVPVGFMLTPDQDRWIVVTMCSGSGPMQMALNLDTGEHRDGEAPAHNEDGAAVHHVPCVFAAAVNLAPPEVGVALALPELAFADFAPTLPPLVGIGRGLAAPPPWATGPPTHL
jgi:cyanate permease